MILRELFAKISVDVRGALANIKKFDKGMDGAKSSMEDAEDQAEKLGDELETTGKKTERFSTRLARNFRNAARTVRQNKDDIKQSLGSVTQGYLAVQAAATAAAAGAFALTNNWAEQNVELDRLARRYQLTTSEVNRLSAATTVSGGDAEEMLEAIKELRLRIGESLLEEGTPLRNALSDLGIAFEDFRKLGVEEQIKLIADRWGELDDVASQTRILDELAGEDLARLVTLLEGGSEGIDKFIALAEKRGLIVRKGDIALSKEFNESVKDMRSLILGLSNDTSRKLAPGIKAIIDEFSKWLMLNREMVTSRIADFLEKLLKLLIDFAPVAANLVESTVDIIDGFGGIDNALLAIVGTMAAFKLGSIAAFGPASPIVAGIAAITGGLALAEKRLDDIDKKRDDARRDRSKDPRLPSEREFTFEDLVDFGGERGENIALLRDSRMRLIKELEGLPDIALVRERGRELQKRVATSGRVVDPEVTKAVVANRDLGNRIKELEEQISLHDDTIKDETDLLREELRLRKDEAAKAAAAESKTEEDPVVAGIDKALRERFRELRQLASQEKLTPAQAKELRQIAKLFPGLDLPDLSFLDKGGDKKKDKSIEELIGLGPKGIKTVSDLLPAGTGTTINNFTFNNTIESPQVTQNINAAPGMSEVEVARQVNTGMAAALTEANNKNQREVLGQVSG